MDIEKRFLYVEEVGGGGRMGWEFGFAAAAAAAKLLQSCLTLFDPIDGSPPGPAVHFSHNKCWSFECVCFSLEVVMVSGVEDHAHHLSFYFKIWY